MTRSGIKIRKKRLRTYEKLSVPINATRKTKKCSKCGNSTRRIERHHILSDLYFDRRLGEIYHHNYQVCPLLCERCHAYISSINAIFRQFYWKKLGCEDKENRTYEQYDKLRWLHIEIYKRFLGLDLISIANKSFRQQFAKEMVDELIHKEIEPIDYSIIRKQHEFQWDIGEHP